ncbi:MAG TPA: DUF4167 domain-containing protein [Alphaproteobacteria bacterium]|nr:DUF4167 domain-containing protein [Alphaproteobacteria bacterium]
MRQPTNPKRGRGRNNNGRKPGNTRNQTFDSNGPSIRVRGNAYQVMEKYLTLARDASASGDRIAAENYYQHAEHYYRILNLNNAQDRPAVAMQPNGKDDNGAAETAEADEAGENPSETAPDGTEPPPV